MIALSSHRPHHKDAIYAANQIAAHESWTKVFKMIFYFGQPEPALADSKTRFAPVEGDAQWPTVLEMLRFAGGQHDWAVILNADIILTEKFKGVKRYMEQRGFPAATSRRWNFKPNGALPEIPLDLERNAPVTMDPYDDPRIPKVTDRGLDIFIAKPWLWTALAKEMPAGYRMGHCEWDTWVLGKLMQRTHWKMGDFTPSRCVFHPIHEGRNMPLNSQVPKMPEQLYDYAKLPGRKIEI